MQPVTNHDKYEDLEKKYYHVRIRHVNTTHPHKSMKNPQR